jgi:hypothetical protein
LLADYQALLAHLQEQPFVHLGQGEDVPLVDALAVQLVDAVEDFLEVGFRVDTDALDA